MHICLRGSRRDVQAMRSVCTRWRAAIPKTSGPWLVLSRLQEDLPRGSDKTVFVEIVAPDGDGADPRLALLKCLCPPPATSSCWGAAYGSLTLRHDGTNNVFLYCMNCGRDTWIPPLSDGMTPMGIYFDEYPTQLRAIIVCDDYPRLHFERINMDALPRWDEYPGNGQYHMSSVGFIVELILLELLLVIWLSLMLWEENLGKIC